MVLNVHRNHKAYQGRGEGGKGVWRWGRSRQGVIVYICMTQTWSVRARELCERRCGRSVIPVPNKPYGFCGLKATLNLKTLSELMSCVKVEVAVLGAPSLTVLMVSVVVKHHERTRPCRSCMEVEVAVLGSPSLTGLMVSVVVKQD